MLNDQKNSIHREKWFRTVEIPFCGFKTSSPLIHTVYLVGNSIRPLVSDCFCIISKKKKDSDFELGVIRVIFH